MSNWDHYIFSDEDNIDFLDELADLDEQDMMESLEDTVTIALRQPDTEHIEYRNGLCAATVAAIWCGAPFSAAIIADEHPFIRGHIGMCPDKLQELSLQLLDQETQRVEEAEDEDFEGLETFVEALS